MSFLISTISFFWFVRTIKFVLFWIYLWQLKEYHIGRLLDHFETHKGQKIFFNLLQTLKIILLFSLLILSYYFFGFVFYILFLVYAFESTFFLKNILQKNLKLPKFTFKAIFLVSISSILTALFLLKAYGLKDDLSFVVSILLFDLFTPIIISFVVLFFQPPFVFLRNRTMKKAEEKISKYKNLVVIGITGSYGKTSTKEFLTTILSSKFNVLATKDHQNSEIGIAQCILNNLNENHHIFAVEMGSYKKGGIKLLCDIVKPKIGIVTGANEQHLALFGTMENLLSAEGGLELTKALPKDGILVINGDNKYCLDLYKKIGVSETPISAKVYTVKGNKIDSDIWTEDIAVEKDSLTFIAMTNEKEMMHFNVNVLGKQNVQNLLAAILVAKELGMSLEEISLACKNIKPKQAGIILKRGIHGIDVIDSSYSSNPD